MCSEGGACDNLPCGLDDFGECPCVKDDNFDDEGIPFKQNHDFDNGKHNFNSNFGLL